MNSKKTHPITFKQQKTWENLMKLGKKCGCHQLQSRSFFYKNFQFPLCARCTGIFLGEFLLAPVFLSLGYNNYLLNLILLSIMAIDGLLQYFKILQSNNIRRLITGLMGGYALMSFTILFITFIVHFL